MIPYERLQRGLVFIASRLVPREQREQWLAEWLTELWYGHRDSPGLATGFAAGAFRDALWLRRNPPLPRAYGPLLIELREEFPIPPPPDESHLLESPVACLVFLGVLAAAFAALPGQSGVPLDTGGDLLVLALLALLTLLATTTLSLGDYPRDAHRERRWLFLAAKLILILLTAILALCRLASSGWVQTGVWGAFWGSHMAIRWALADQRARCPVCLRRLANPVRMGSTAHILLEWNGTELVCPRGHGLLHVPGHPAVWFSRQRWLRM